MLTRSRRRTTSLLRSFRGDGRGVAATEFAFVMPVLVLLFGASVEFGGAYTAGVRATRVAESVGQVVAQAQASISVDDMSAIIRTASLIDPDIIAFAKETGKSLDKAANITISSVAFKPVSTSCGNACTYDAYVVFSEALAGPKRPCGKLSVGSASSVSELPAEVYSANAIVVIDVEVFYKPIMTLFMGNQISFKRSLFFRPRYLDQVNYANNCSGFPST